MPGHAVRGSRKGTEMNLDRVHDQLEMIMAVSLAAGLVAAVKARGTASTTPVVMLLVSSLSVQVMICMELITLRGHLVGMGVELGTGKPLGQAKG